MIEKVECPFCGVIIHFAMHPTLTDAPEEQCPLVGYSFSWAQWAMRPPKKECSDLPKIQSEVEWLRAMVERLTIEPEPVQPLHIEYKPNEATK